MNIKTISDINVGMQASVTRIITEADIISFSEISGDKNPIHLDEEYAKNSRYKKRIAHGFISASLFSGLFGTKLPGEGCVYAAQSLRFKRAVYIDDEVTASITVEKIDLKAKKVFFTTVCKVKNKVVIKGDAEIFIP